MILILTLFLIGLTILYGVKNYSYWIKKNVKHPRPWPFFGNNLRQYFLVRSMAELATETYKLYPNEQFVGFYRGLTPELLIRDPDIVKSILTSDFASFHARGASIGRNADAEPLLKNLFQVDGDNWKLLRQKFTPAFSSGKLKSMFYLIIECANKLQFIAEELVEERNGIYDVRELMARYTTDFIGSCGFGVKMDTLNDEKSEFRELGKRIFEIRPIHAIKLLGKTLFPHTFRNIKFYDQDIEDTITSLIQTCAEQRNHKPSGRNDFIDLMLELKEKGKVYGESLDKKNDDGTPQKIELELDLTWMAAQAFVFFAAGFETSSSATSFTLHQLAFHPDIQNKVQAEIDEVISKHNGLCYDAIREMTYLEMCFKEAMRIFPSVGVLNRECSKKCKVPGTDITIDKGVKIIIPVAALHSDEKYSDDPEEYRPDRFTPEECSKRHNCVYLPFGEGPRNCIGLRLGHMQSMAGLAAFLHKFSVEPTTTTVRYPEICHSTEFVQSIKGGLPLKIVKRA